MLKRSYIWVYLKINRTPFRFQTQNVNITVPTRTNAIESCTTDTFYAQLVWSSKESNESKNSIFFYFSKLEKNLLRHVIINIFMDKENFPNAISMRLNFTCIIKHE